MPRTRLARHLFTVWCVLVLAILAGCLWLSSVQLAALSEESHERRLSELGGGLAAVLGDELSAADPASRANRLRSFSRHTGVEVELLGTDGAPLDSAADPIVGRTGAGEWYDAATGRRWLVVQVPHGPSAGSPTAFVRLAADAAAPDRGLRRAQIRLAAGAVALAGLAVAAGWLAAGRAARPVEEVCRAATRLAAGDVPPPLLSTELAEVEELAAALGRLREQLVERGLTIGRQGTQQEAVLGSMIEGVLAIDARQRIVGINRAAADLLGVDLDDVLRRPLQEVVRNPDLRRFALLAIDCREPVEDDLVLRGPQDRTIRLRGTALRDVSGEGGAVIVLNDVTAIERLETVRRDFVANVSHELKTPVASIKGFVETLLDGAMDDAVNRGRFLEIVGRQADRLASIIEDLLALSRIEQSEGAGNLPLEPVRIAEVLAAVVADCGPRAAERSIGLETNCPEALVADVNPPLLEQAVINLVDNAIKYSDPGSTVRLTAEVGPGRVGGEVVVRVADEGAGIDAEHLPRLFERFYRVDKARSRKLGGTGLGLSIVKHIVQAHRGSVTVESEPGVGSTFTIRLPSA